MVVTAQLQRTVAAVILTSEANRKEGGQVDMTCTATNLGAGDIVAWRTEDPEKVLIWGPNRITTQSRFVFNTWYTSISTVQNFTIMNVQRSDTDEYVCTVYQPISTGGSNAVASSRVTLSVLYFPTSSFPVCSPAGPVTVDEGTNLYLKCSSEIGNPLVAVAVTQVPAQSNSYTWASSTVGSSTIESSLTLLVNAPLDNITFDCTVTSLFYFPSMKASCTIGPINVAKTATTIGSVETTSMITSTTSIATLPITSSSNLAVIIGAAVGGVAAILLITILIIICLRRGLFKCALFPKESKLDAGQSSAEESTEIPRQSFNEYAGLESIQTTSQTTRDANSTSPRHTVSPRHSESSIQTGPIYAQPNKVKSNMDNSPAVMRQPISTEQTYDNPVFDQDIVTSPAKDHFYASSDKPIATVKPMAAKPPKKPQPYKPKSSHKIPDNNLNHQENLMPFQSPTVPQDETILPDDPTYAEVASVPKRQPSSHDNQDGIVYADLDLQSDSTRPDISKSSPADDGQVVYATVTTT
ncbi:uncharacterized protein [Asterias amurensis]|uniref:uncharacterized protein n=1 Tax=Asterias amurensis TaxID=7602 RepID=UPI003AB56971